MSARITFKRVRRGEKINADDYNRVLETIESLCNIRAGNGLSATFGDDGIMIALTSLIKDRAAIVKITAAPTAGQPIKPSLCSYSCLGLDKKFELTNVLPVYGREVANDEVDVYPAKVGDLAFVLRNPQDDGTKKAELWILSEYIVRGAC